MSILPYKPSPSEFIRGGRLRKTSKGLISFAPFLAGASVLALGALMAATTSVEAGNCDETATAGVWTCTGAADSTNDMMQTIETPTAGGALEITDDGTFGLDVSSGQGLAVTGGSSGTSVTVNINGDVTADNQAVYVKQEGTGAVSVTTSGTITSGVGGFGAIEVQQDGIGAVSVTTRGNIDKESTHGIYVETATVTEGDVEVEVYDGNIESSRTGVIVKNLGSGEVSITTNADFDATASGIYVDQVGANNVTITTTGGIIDAQGVGIGVRTNADGTTTGDILIESNSTITTNGISEGIFVNQRGSGAVTITTDGTINSNNVTGNSDNDEGIRVMTADGVTTGDVGITVNNDITGGSGIEVDNQGSGNVTINVNAEVEATDSSGNAINLKGKGTHTIILGTGASIAGVVDAEEDVVANIEVAGNVSNFNFGNLGSGVDSFTVNEGSVLGIEGAQSWSGAVTLSGRLVITGNHPIRETGSTFSVASIEGGGVIDIDVDFSGGDASLSEPRISAQSATGSTTVNVRARGGFPAIPETDEDEAITIGNFIQITDNGAAPDTFVAGRALGGGFNFELTHDNAGNGPSIWTLVATGISVEGALYETLPAALTQLARLESYRQRLQGRQHGGSGGAWAKVSNTSGEFEPTATSLATHEIENAVVEFGIDVPFRISSSGSPDNFTVGASVGFGDATTDVTIENGTGEIATSTVKGAISANWEYGSAYVDGQLQYATFGNEFKSDANLVDKNATAYSAGLEVGYDMNIAGVRVIPAAQLAWTSVDVGTFTDSAGTQVVLDDGVVLTGRAGIGAEYGWDGVLFGLAPFADILLRGRADVLMPLDGKVGTKISETEMTSEREDPVFDFGIGATYAWGDAYAFSADVSARQGGEVEGYAGSVGFEYKF